MFLDPEQARARLESEDNLANRFSRGDSAKVLGEESVVIERAEDSGDSPQTDRVSIVPKMRPGQEDGDKRLIPAVRDTITILARGGGGRQKDIATAFDVTQGEVSALKRGAVQSINEDKVEKALGEMRDKALEKLMSSLNLITDEKLGKCKATDLSVVAANMSKIVEKSLPRQQDSRDINLVVYAPELRQERNFKTIEV